MAKGGKKKGGKRKRTQWDDETDDMPKKQRGSAEEAGSRKKRGESMFTQWKKQKQVLTQKRRVVESSIAQRKHGQYIRLKGVKDGDDTDEEQHDYEGKDEGSDVDTGSSDDDDDDAKPSAFNSFVSRFQRQTPSFQEHDQIEDEVEDTESDQGDIVEEDVQPTTEDAESDVESEEDDEVPVIRQVTMMHVVNHILKSRDTIARHNERLSKKGASDEAEYRDQGFSRPTVLVLAPLRSSAHALVHQLLDLLPSTVTTVHNKDRFDEEFGDSDQTDDTADKEDGTEWQQIFQAGNNDDAFQIGISFARKSVNRADLIIASPLALRQKVGDILVDIVPGDKSTLKLPVDFLSSIEVCVLASVFLMQNMDHVRAVMNAINVTPKEAPHADFSRIREWNLNHQAHYFRQTIVLAHAADAQLNNLLTKSCHNFRGVTRLAPVYDLHHVVPSVSHVIPSIKQIFQRLDTPSQPATCPLVNEPNARFEYFERQILAPLLDHPSKHTMVL
ncbi:hypothetical protein DYB30_005233 [Aphanomyces astaci]|uniref:UTP25 NTP hydrolase-like domain-containing protein n=1 Tax=Aphanomyces astaci TaxID=112090 RepID=A0A397ECS9_APHAT|nr:hypothetical protein DYB30_005233 [Aphanomyces astaci]